MTSIPPRRVTLPRAAAALLAVGSVLAPVAAIHVTVTPLSPGFVVLASLVITPLTMLLVRSVLWPGISRTRAALRGVAALLGGVTTLPVVFATWFVLCSSEGATTYVTHRELVVVAVAPLLVYLAAAGLVVLAARHVALLWACATGGSLLMVPALLALFGGGAHHCYS